MSFRSGSAAEGPAVPRQHRKRWGRTAGSSRLAFGMTAPNNSLYCGRSSHSRLTLIYYSRMNSLRFLMLLALSVWLGGLLFFPVVAQTAFSALPSTHLAGLVVRNSLFKLHWMAFVSGAVFLASSLIYNRIMHGSPRTFALRHVLVLTMLALTAISQFKLIPRMDVLRASVKEIASLSADDPIRRQFDSLHAWSTRIEETVLVLGLIVLCSTARRIASSQA
jgi:hypothetical protein